MSYSCNMRLVQAKMAAYAITTEECGCVYTNEGAAGAPAGRALTLPTAAAGLCFEFLIQDAVGLRVVAAAGDTISINANVSGAAGNIESVELGAAVRLLAVNADEWQAVHWGGTWAVT